MNYLKGLFVLLFCWSNFSWSIVSGIPSDIMYRHDPYDAASWVKVKIKPKPQFYLVEVILHPQFEREKYKHPTCPPANTWVIVEGDRGEDAGQTSGICIPLNEGVTGPSIIRVATNAEFDCIQRLQKEAQRRLNQLPEREIPTSMQIHGARIQFNKRKFILYYTSRLYLQFNPFVHFLFRKYGVRIWLKWIGTDLDAARIDRS